MQDDIYQLKEQAPGFSEDRTGTTFPAIGIETGNNNTLYTKLFEVGASPVTLNEIVTLDDNEKLVSPFSTVEVAQVEKVDKYSHPNSFIEMVSNTRAIRITGTSYPYTMECLDISNKSSPVVLYSVSLPLQSNLSYGWGVQWLIIPPPQIAIEKSYASPLISVLLPCNNLSGSSFQGEGTYEHIVNNYQMLTYSMGVSSFTLTNTVNFFGQRVITTNSALPPNAEDEETPYFPDAPKLRFDDVVKEPTTSRCSFLIFEDSIQSDIVVFFGWWLITFSNAGTILWNKRWSEPQGNDYIDSDIIFLAKIITSTTINGWDIFILKHKKNLFYGLELTYEFKNSSTYGGNILTNTSYAPSPSFPNLASEVRDVIVVRLDQFPSITSPNAFMLILSLKDTNLDAYGLYACMIGKTNPKTDEKLIETGFNPEIANLNLLMVNPTSQRLGVMDYIIDGGRVYTMPTLGQTGFNLTFTGDFSCIRLIKRSLPRNLKDFNIVYSGTKTLLGDSYAFHEMGDSFPSTDKSSPLGIMAEAGNPTELKKVILGGVVDGLSGLTPDALYYYDVTTNSLTLENTGILIGRALTATKLFLLLQ